LHIDSGLAAVNRYLIGSSAMRQTNAAENKGSDRGNDEGTDNVSDSAIVVLAYA